MDKNREIKIVAASAAISAALTSTIFVGVDRNVDEQREKVRVAISEVENATHFNFVTVGAKTRGMVRAELPYGKTHDEIVVPKHFKIIDVRTNGRFVAIEFVNEDDKPHDLVAWATLKDVVPQPALPLDGGVQLSPAIQPSPDQPQADASAVDGSGADE